MEGHGTNMDRSLQLEGEVHGLRKDVNEIRAETLETRAQLNIVVAGQESIVKAIDSLAARQQEESHKLDEQRTRRPDLMALAGIGVAFFSLLITTTGVGWILINSWLDPIRSNQTQHRIEIQSMSTNRWRLSDQIRYEDAQLERDKQLIEMIHRDDDHLHSDIKDLDNRVRILEMTK